MCCKMVGLEDERTQIARLQREGPVHRRQRSGRIVEAATGLSEAQARHGIRPTRRDDRLERLARLARVAPAKGLGAGAGE